MTPASFSNTRSVNDIITRNMTNPPSGWHIANEQSVDRGGDVMDMKQLKINLQIAGYKALELIDEIQMRTEIQIPEAYLRVEKENIFHLLLLVTQPDFLSPKLIGAKILAENSAKKESRIDMRTSFGNIDENTRKNVIIKNGYKLLHLETDNV